MQHEKREGEGWGKIVVRSSSIPRVLHYFPDAYLVCFPLSMSSKATLLLLYYLLKQLRERRSRPGGCLFV